MTHRTVALLTYGGALLIIVADQVSKAWVIQSLGDGQPPIEIVPGVLDLIYRLNTGMAFSLLVNFPSLLTVVAAIASIALVVVIWRLKSPGLWQNSALALLLGGAAGNLIDRLRYGAVVDFVYFKPINFPAFNIADSALTIGVLLAAWTAWRTSIEQARDDTTPAHEVGPTGSDSSTMKEDA